MAGPLRTREILSGIKFHSRTIREASKSLKIMGRWDMLPSNHDPVSHLLPPPSVL